MEKKLAVNFWHDIVASMNEGTPKMNEESASDHSGESSYVEALERYKELRDSVEEAGEYVFREKPAVGKEETTMARLELEIDGCLSEAEACAQRGDYNGEKVMRMIADFKKAEADILGIYFDARNESPEFAEILEEDFKFIGEVNKDVPEIEFE